MNQDFRLADDDELQKRRRQLDQFFERMLDTIDRPFFVSDEACLYDILGEDEEVFRCRFERLYGSKLTPADFRRPLWELLDSLPSP